MRSSHNQDSLHHQPDNFQMIYQETWTDQSLILLFSVKMLIMQQKLKILTEFKEHPHNQTTTSILFNQI